MCTRTPLSTSRPAHAPCTLRAPGPPARHAPAPAPGGFFGLAIAGSLLLPELRGRELAESAG
ncbi:MAG TPA: hypothetical protein VNP72_04170 [Longimicrobium sp.]|nr:hypothetical protein [Longimicrobium sp.]